MVMDIKQEKRKSGGWMFTEEKLDELGALTSLPSIMGKSTSYNSVKLKTKWECSKSGFHRTNMSYYHFIYCSTVLCWAFAAFTVSWSFTPSVGLLDGGSARRKAVTCTLQHKHRINAHRHPCLKWDSNPRLSFRIKAFNDRLIMFKKLISLCIISTAALSLLASMVSVYSLSWGLVLWILTGLLYTA
jgi:hypothetical protein